MTYRPAFAALAVLLAAGGLAPADVRPTAEPRPTVDILVDGRPLTTYHARDTIYVEATKGREYEICIRNPYPVRVAVALSVDGLNTIDARRTSAAAARKWVIEPHGTITIGGWQTSLEHARRFEFTTEERSYGAWLGRANDLGVIAAVFYRERQRQSVAPIWSSSPRQSDAPGTAPQAGGVLSGEAPAPVASERQEEAGARASAANDPSPAGAALARPAAADEYAATGIGRQVQHAVTQVHFEVEPSPAASICLRYEYREQLVRLGVLPDTPVHPDALERRERARGFDPGFCPDPHRSW